MGLESEIKLSLPRRAASLLAAHPLLAGLPATQKKLNNIYYDTPALALHDRRIAVRHRRVGDDCLLTVKSAAPAAGGLAQRHEWENASPPGEFDFSHIDNPALRHQLETLRMQLTPVFATHFMRTTWHVPTLQGQVEVALDQGQIEADGRKESICEVEIELLSGQIGALFEVACALQAVLPLHPEVGSKAERGYRLFSGQTIAAVKAQTTPLTPDDCPADAFRHIALACLVHLQGNEYGVRHGDDPEPVHQARVAIRRLRTALRIWRPLLPENFLVFDAAWRHLARTLGDARNHDVLLLEILRPLAHAFPAQRDVQALLRRAQAAGKRQRKAARLALVAPDYSRLLLEFTSATLSLDAGNQPQLEDFARRCLKRRAKRVAQLTPDLPMPAITMLHPLRIALKRLRYALEFFAGFFPQRRYQRYHLKICHLLDLLGQLNDHSVAGQLAGSNARLDAWLAGCSAVLLHQLPQALHDFTACPPPWQHH